MRNLESLHCTAASEDGLSLAEEWRRLFHLAPESTVRSHTIVSLSERLEQARNGVVSSGVDRRALQIQFSETRLPETVMSQEEYLEFLSTRILPHGANIHSRYCLGHMSGSPPEFFWRVTEIINAINQNMAKYDSSRVFSHLERAVLATMHRLVFTREDEFYERFAHCHASSLGVMTSGATLANLTALWVARNQCLGPSDGFRGVEEEGLAAALRHYGCDGLVLLASDLTHYSIDKAAALLGLGSDQVIKVPVDSAYRMKIAGLRDALRQADRRRQRVAAIVAAAGTTDAGSVDRLADVAEIAREAGVHLHVDAAWGAPLLFSERQRDKLRGIASAASVTVDGHKQLHLPIGNSMVLFGNPAAAATIEKRAAYMLQEDSGDLGARSVEGSRPASALLFHAALHVIGARNYERMIDESLRKAAAFADLVRDHPDLELLAEPETGIVLYRWLRPGPGKGWRRRRPSDVARLNAFNEAIQKAQSAAGRMFVSRTMVPDPGGGGAARPQLTALRAVIANPFSQIEDLAAVVADQMRVAGELAPLIWDRP